MKMSVAKMWSTWSRWSALGLMSVVVCSSPSMLRADDEKEEKLLTIGSKAPELDVEHWVQDGKGAFKPVTKFESGKVYIVEFWATWCGPCIASMPHLSELQTKYRDRGVQIVSISDEDLSTVEEFLNREVQGGGAKDGDAKAATAKTYRDLTSTYCLTTDPDGSCKEDYMNAAQQNGIPTSFIVGKQGVIEWIGHPMEIDKPLESVLDDKWNRDEFLAEFKASQEAQQKMSKIFGLMSRNKVSEALKLLDETIESVKGSPMERQYKVLKLQIMMQGKDKDALSSYAKDLFAELKGDGMMINQIAWAFVQMTDAGQLDNKDLLKVALQAAEAESKDAPGPSKFAILDTVAHLHYLTGDIDKAIEVQKAALELASDNEKAQLQDFLSELLEEKKSAKK